MKKNEASPRFRYLHVVEGGDVRTARAVSFMSGLWLCVYVCESCLRACARVFASIRCVVRTMYIFMCLSYDSRREEKRGGGTSKGKRRHN